jgi:MFS family permease
VHALAGESSTGNHDAVALAMSGPGSAELPAGSARSVERSRARPGWSDRLAFPILLMLAVTDAAGYSVIGPVLPTLQRATGASDITTSMLATCFPLAMLLGFVLAGQLANGGGTRLALIVGLAFLLAGALAFMATAGMAVLFAARAAMGIGSGCLWIAVTFRTLRYWPGQEYLCMSRIYAAYSVGALVGPALATLGGVRAPFAAYGLVLVLCLPLVLALPAPPSAGGLVADRTMIRLPGFWVAAVAIMFAIMATGTLDGVLPLHFAAHLGQAAIGVAYTGTAVLIALASVLAGSVRPAVGLALGGSGICAGITLAGATSNVPVWLGALALIGLGAGAAQTGATGVLLQAVPTERIVTAMVVWSQMGIVGYLIAPAVGGPLAARFGYGWLGLLPLAAACALAVSVLPAYRARRRSARTRSGFRGA